MSLASLRDALHSAWTRLHPRLPRWVLVLGWSGRDFVIDDGLHWAAAVAFYGVLSLFPLVLAGVDILSHFVDPHGANRQTADLLARVMPQSEVVRGIVDHAVADRPQIGVVSFFFLLYTGGRVFSILTRALNVACDLDEAYGFFKRLLVECTMLLSVGFLFLGALVINLLLPVLGHLLSAIPHATSLLLTLGAWFLPSLLLLSGFFYLYKFVPRHRCNWQSALVGAALATVACAVARPLFVVYVGKLASYRQIYGWLTIGVLFMVWAQIISVITIYCGELASHVQMIVYDGLPPAEVSRRHRARAPGRSSTARVRPDAAPSPHPTLT